jgi:hypothetical protein
MFGCRRWGAGEAAGDVGNDGTENECAMLILAWEVQVREVIAGALRRLPATADMLYLEYCFDECSAEKYGSTDISHSSGCFGYDKCRALRS